MKIIKTTPKIIILAISGSRLTKKSDMGTKLSDSGD
jgi:hypothetical protein